jgi:hypothetical protein
VPRFNGDCVIEENVSGLEIDRDITAGDPLIKYGDIDRDAFPVADLSFDVQYSVFGLNHFRSEIVFKQVGAHQNMLAN